MKTTFGILTALLICACGIRAAELDLVREGKALAVIQLAADADGPEQHAAEELQRAIRLMSGAELSIQTGEAGSGPAIVIGQIAEPGEGEEIQIRRDGSTLYLLGRTPREALHATYTFLQETLGVRWLWPGEEGEFIPKRESIAVGELDRRYVPSIPFRSVAVTSVKHGYQPDTDLWMARNRMNLQSAREDISSKIVEERRRHGLMIRIAGHNVKLPPETLEAHPEYAALFAGERRTDTRVPPQLCWSNPEVVRLIAEEIGRWWEVDGVDFAAPYSSDNAHFCECDACVAMGDVSTRWQKFSLQVIELLEKKYPGRQYMTLAYQAYRPPPKGPLAPFVNNGYCIYNGCYRHSYDDDCEANPLALKELLEWQEKGGKMGIRGYEMIMFREPIFAPMVGFMVDQARWAKKHGLVSVMTESPPYNHPPKEPLENQRWASNKITYYATARAMWDATVTRDEIVRDWYSTIYGPAAEPMAASYLAMETAWRATPGHITYFLNPAATYANGFITQELVTEMERLYAEARRRLTETPEGPERQRRERELAFEQTLFGRWKDHFLVQQGRQDRMEAAAVITAEAPELKADPNETLWEKAPLFPAFEDAQGALVNEKTEVRALWTADALYLRFVAQHLSEEPILQRFKERDQAIYGDDSIEIFFNPDPSSPAYVHLAINTLGIVWDARSAAGMNLDKGWNGDWSAAARVEGQRWIIDVKLPFSTFGIAPKDGDELAINFTRNRPGRLEAFPPSGWPDSSNHNPSGYGRLRLVKEAPKPLAIYAVGGDGLMAAMVEQRLRPVRMAAPEALAAALQAGEPRAVLMRYPWARGAELSGVWLREQLLPYLKSGGVVFLVVRSEPPLHDWFPEEKLAVQWVRDPAHPIRRVTKLADGVWTQEPNALDRAFQNGTPPRQGLRPLSSGWEVLAAYQLESGAEMPFLLKRSVGEGALFVTSSWFGFGGRHEIFGDGNARNAARLLENLLVTGSRGSGRG